MEFQHTTTIIIIIIGGRPHDGASPYPRFHANSIAIVLANVEKNEIFSAVQVHVCRGRARVSSSGVVNPL